MDKTALAVIGGETWSSGKQASCLEIEGLEPHPRQEPPMTEKAISIIKIQAEMIFIVF